jgi:hypothetical protein
MNDSEYNISRRAVESARDWLNSEQTMGAPRDVLDAFEDLEEATEQRDADAMVETSESVMDALEGAHPTVRSIVGAAPPTSNLRHHWRPTLRKIRMDLKNKDLWEDEKLEAFRPLADQAQRQAENFLNENPNVETWEEAKEIAIANVLVEAVWGRDLPEDYDRSFAAQDIERLLEEPE